jgi:hypothetical protein
VICKINPPRSPGAIEKRVLGYDLFDLGAEKGIKKILDKKLLGFLRYPRAISLVVVIEIHSDSPLDHNHTAQSISSSDSKFSEAQSN